MLQGEWFEKYICNSYGPYAWCMTRCLNVLYKYMKFRWNISDGYHVIERTRFCDGYPRTDAREITYMQELWFLCMTRRLNVFHKCMKLRWNTSNGYGHEIALQMIKGKQLQNIQSGVMVLVRDTLSAWSFNQIPLTVFNLQSGPKNLVLLQGKLFEKLTCKSYGSCAWHVVWMCLTNVWNFVEISLTVFKL